MNEGSHSYRIHEDKREITIHIDGNVFGVTICKSQRDNCDWCLFRKHLLIPIPSRKFEIAPNWNNSSKS